MICDEGSFVELDTKLKPIDPIRKGRRISKNGKSARTLFSDASLHMGFCIILFTFADMDKNKWERDD